MLAWRGEEHSTYNPYDINTATPQIIIGAQSLHAVGYAMGIQIDGTDQVAAAYFGDGATSQGDVNEAMVFASSFRAPVVFVCTNNQWAISEPVTVQAKFPIAGRAPGLRHPEHAGGRQRRPRVPRGDALGASTTRARGNGPAFIEAVTYRMGPHTTSDDPTRYRDKDEVERWRRRDPIDPRRGAAARAGRVRRGVRARRRRRGRPLGRGCALGMPVGAHQASRSRSSTTCTTSRTSGLDVQRAHFAAYLDGFADAAAGGGAR